MHFKAICQNRRSYYTVPIKALANEKFLSLCHIFGPDQVGMITGDATVNPGAPVICCTAEILANLALRDGERARVDDVIMDEFHYYSDASRGFAWQVPLLTLPQARFLLMSATLGETAFFEDTLTQLTCAQTAQNLMSANFCTKEEKQGIAELLHDANFRSPYGKEVSKLLRHGIGIHHAGLLPKYRILVEKLTQKGLLKVICGTDTLGVGVNVPVRTVVFTRLFKYDGTSTKTLAVRDFKQIAGRAGRRGFDTSGTVVAQAPEHVIENLRLGKKAAASGKKCFVKRKPPEKGFVNWDEDSLKRLIDGAPEKLVSSLQVQHSMLLNVLAREHEDGCAALRKIINDSHETPTKKKALRRRAFQRFRGLVEAILENPDVILRKQVDLLKNELIARLKNEGVEFDERMERLEEVEWPRPGKDFIYATYNEFVARRPWMKETSVRPKSIAREMFENWQSFEDYIKTYGLERSEAVLLRHLSEVYKVLAQTVPPLRKTPQLIEAEEYLEDILRGVDSSLLDEWEKLRNPEYVPLEERPMAERKAVAFTRNRPTFTRALRNAVFTLVKAFSEGNTAAILAQIEPNDPDGAPWTATRIESMLDDYFAEHTRIRLDPEARAAKHTHFIARNLIARNLLWG